MTEEQLFEQMLKRMRRLLHRLNVHEFHSGIELINAVRYFPPGAYAKVRDE